MVRLIFFLLLLLTVNAIGDKDPFPEKETSHATESAIYILETSTPYIADNITFEPTTNAATEKTDQVTKKRNVNRHDQKKPSVKHDNGFTITPHSNQSANISHSARNTDAGKSSNLEARTDGQMNKLLDIKSSSRSGKIEDSIEDDDVMVDHRRSDRREQNSRNGRDEISKNYCDHHESQNPGVNNGDVMDMTYKSILRRIHDNPNTLLDSKSRRGNFDHVDLDNLPQAETTPINARASTTELSDTKTKSIDDYSHIFSANAYAYQPEMIPGNANFQKFEPRSDPTLEPFVLENVSESPFGIENLQSRRTYLKKDLGPAYLPRAIELNTGEHWNDLNVLPRGNPIYLNNKRFEKFHSYLFNNDLPARHVLNAQSFLLNGDETPRNMQSFMPHHGERRFNQGYHGSKIPNTFFFEPALEHYPNNIYHSPLASPVSYNPNELVHKVNPPSPPAWNNILQSPIQHQRIYPRHVNDDHLMAMMPRRTLDDNLRIGRPQGFGLQNRIHS